MVMAKKKTYSKDTRKTQMADRVRTLESSIPQFPEEYFRFMVARIR
jgi:hypothetical protein